MRPSRLFALVATSILLVLVGILVWRPAPVAQFKISALDSQLRSGTDETLQIYVFLNFTDPASRQAFERFVDLPTSVLFEYPVTVHFLHFPGASCSTFEPPSSCFAAVAVECAEKLTPGQGLQYANSVFALQWAKKTAKIEHLLDSAEEHGYERSEFRACVTRNNDDILARIDSHYMSSSSAGLAQVPAVWMRWAQDERVAFLGQTTDPRALRFAAKCLIDTCGDDS